MHKRMLYKKLVGLNFIHNKNPVILISIIGLLVFLFLIQFLFIFKVFMILASIALGIKLWDKRHTFFQKNGMYFSEACSKLFHNEIFVT